MPIKDIFDSIGKVEPCDGRDLLQKLTYLVISEVSTWKVKQCSELETVFVDFGLANFSPCDLVTPTLFTQLISGNPQAALNSMLIGKNLPPHTLPILANGYGSLTSEQQKDVENYLKQKGVAYIRGQIEPVLREEIAKVIKCPSEDTTRKVLNKLENITRILSNLQSKVNRLDTYVSVTSATVSALRTSINASKNVVLGLEASLPAISVLPAPVGTQSGLISNIIRKVTSFTDKNERDIIALDVKLCNAAKGLQAVNNQLIILQAFLSTIDTLLRSCMIESPDFASRITPRSYSPRQEATGYRGYTIEIREDQSSRGPAPRRYAVALDINGIVVLQGTSSYSSSTDILIEELKFRIDNHLG